MIGAYSSFGTVFMENFFSVPKSMAPLLAGGIIVPAAAWGTWYGGTHEAKYHTKLTQTAFWNVKMACISLVAAVLQATQSCSNPDIKGVNMNDFSFEAPACAVNASCGCSQTYQPLCFNDEVTYFSPCHAGCTDWMKKEGDRVENGINSTACSCWEGEEVSHEHTPMPCTDCPELRRSLRRCEQRGLCSHIRERDLHCLSARHSHKQALCSHHRPLCSHMSVAATRSQTAPCVHIAAPFVHT